MNNIQLFYPCLFLITMTCLVLLRLLHLRVKGMFKGVIHPKHFRTFDHHDKLPRLEVQTQRNFTNLHETPLVFYAVCGFSMILNKVDQTQVILAWIFVFLRVSHSLVHLTFNHVNTRFTLFLLSILALLFMGFRIVL